MFPFNLRRLHCSNLYSKECGCLGGYVVEVDDIFILFIMFCCKAVYEYEYCKSHKVYNTRVKNYVHNFPTFTQQLISLHKTANPHYAVRLIIYFFSTDCLYPNQYPHNNSSVIHKQSYRLFITLPPPHITTYTQNSNNEEILIMKKEIIPSSMVGNCTVKRGK